MGTAKKRIKSPSAPFATDWTVLASNPGGGAGIFAPVHTSLLYNGYRVPFPAVKRPGRGVNRPSPSSAEVKERIELYLYSPSWFNGLF